MLAGMQELGKHGRVYSLHRSLIYRGHYMITRLWRSFPLLCQILSHRYIATIFCEAMLGRTTQFQLYRQRSRPREGQRGSAHHLAQHHYTQ